MPENGFSFDCCCMAAFQNNGCLRACMCAQGEWDLFTPFHHLCPSHIDCLLKPFPLICTAGLICWLLCDHSLQMGATGMEHIQSQWAHGWTATTSEVNAIIRSVSPRGSPSLIQSRMVSSGLPISWAVQQPSPANQTLSQPITYCVSPSEVYQRDAICESARQTLSICPVYPFPGRLTNLKLCP